MNIMRTGLDIGTSETSPLLIRAKARKEGVPEAQAFQGPSHRWPSHPGHPPHR